MDNLTVHESHIGPGWFHSEPENKLAPKRRLCPACSDVGKVRDHALNVRELVETHASYPSHRPIGFSFCRSRFVHIRTHQPYKLHLGLAAHPRKSNRLCARVQVAAFNDDHSRLLHRVSSLIPGGLSSSEVLYRFIAADRWI